MKALLIGLCLLMATSYVVADVTLPRLVSDGVILQRDKPINIWGWADEGEKVSVTLGKQILSTKAESGRWQLTFKPLRAGSSYTLDIQGKNHLQIKNVLIGDVWIAAGQSNMELPINRVLDRYPNIISTTNLPEVREFSVPVIYSFKGKQTDYPTGQWKTATPENLSGFSAVGFFFSRSLYEKNHIPIGLIMLPVGGSPAEAWMSEEALQSYPQHLAEHKKFTDDNYLQKTIAQDKAVVDALYTKNTKEDKGLDAKHPWSSEKLSANEWQSLTIPGNFHDQKIDFTNGILWLRKTLILNEQQVHQTAEIRLGAIVDGDEVYINGQLVGQTGYKYPPRIYTLKPGILKAGENAISIRLTSYSSNPEFVKDKTYALRLGSGSGSGSEKIDLSGEWKYKVGMRGEAFPKTTTIHYQPASLFNAKLAPALQTAFKGVIWYQGESNTGRAKEYETLFADLIRDWRGQFKQGDFPFLFVQLANFMVTTAQPVESEWADTRAAQRKALSVKNTAMVVAIDAGEWNDIHPLNKQVVGERLALAAQKLAYGDRKVIASGPNANFVKRDKEALLISFDKNGGNLAITNDGVLHQIAIAGADKKYVWANAKIQGKQLRVWSEQVPQPVSVRYAWADNPEGANLYNTAGLPASPFELSIP